VERTSFTLDFASLRGLTAGDIDLLALSLSLALNLNLIYLQALSLANILP